jgi:tungstate transport system permease protein
MLVDGASRAGTIGPLMKIGQDGLLTAWLAAFGRAISEVGAILIVGGSIRGYTRTMATAIALETSKGDLIRNSLERFREGILGGCLSEYARLS